MTEQDSQEEGQFIGFSCPKEKCGGDLYQHPRIRRLTRCNRCKGLWELREIWKREWN